MNENKKDMTDKLLLWYRQPAGKSYEMDRQMAMLPIGNGYMGALTQGGIATEEIQFNEESLWSGGPGSREGYLFGYRNDAEDGENLAAAGPERVDFATLYEALKDGSRTGTGIPDGIAKMLEGTKTGYGTYRDFGYLSLNYHIDHAEAAVLNYHRELDLAEGIARVSFELGGVRFAREYFASYPDRVMAVEISANRPGSISLDVGIRSGQEDYRNYPPTCTGQEGNWNHSFRYSTAGEGNRMSVRPGTARGGENSSADAIDCGFVTLTGDLADNGMRYAAICKVTQVGGTLAAAEGQVSVRNADTVVLYFNAGTDYRNETALPSMGHFRDLTYRTGETLTQVVDKVVAPIRDWTVEDITAIRRRHLADYQALFGRVTLALGGVNDRPTDEMIAAYEQGGPTARMLETLLYQYGRYLLIASSRPGTLPANLQGKWSPGNNPPWAADYHYNINLQMNYWPAGGADLAETVEPLADFLRGLQNTTGRYTAARYSYRNQTGEDWRRTDGSAGWTLHCSGNIFGLTAPGWSWGWGWSPANNAFIVQNLYQYLRYGGDTEKFKADFWPIIREAAVMWSKALYPATEGRYAGKYIVIPSFSPEHGPLTLATAYDQQLVWELLTFTLDCMDRLNLSDPAFQADIRQKRDNLYGPVWIGEFGQVMEWSESATDFRDSADNGPLDKEHRHLSQLIGFYPGTSIANGSAEHYQAAVKTLTRRGDKATGWSLGWKMNLWARALDGNRVHRLMENFVREYLAMNLFDLHPPFQIDGNFGFTAGVQEMLLQSHLGYLDILPALPAAWESGRVQGIRAIGGHKLDIVWADGKLRELEIKAHATGAIRVRNREFGRCPAWVNGQRFMAVDNVLSLAAVSGEGYRIKLSGGDS